MNFFSLTVFSVILAMVSGHNWNHRLNHNQHNLPKYEYKYGIKDMDTGDNKRQWEHRDGDQVKGGYSFLEADGSIRVVEYYVDSQSGFRAVVRRIDPQLYDDFSALDTHHEHIAYNGYHVQHDQQGRAKSYVNALGYN